MSERELEVVQRIIKFAIPAIAQPARITILYQNDDTASAEEAAWMKAQLLATKNNATVTSDISLQSIENTDFTGADVVLLTSKIRDGSEQIAQATRASGSITVSNSKECAKKAYCVFSIKTKPLINLWYSRAAARAAGLRFAPALLLLAKKI